MRQLAEINAICDDVGTLVDVSTTKSRGGRKATTPIGEQDPITTLQMKWVRGQVEQRDWSQSRLSRESGIDNATVSGHFRGKKPILNEQWLKYLAAFNFDMIGGFKLLIKMAEDSKKSAYKDNQELAILKKSTQ